MKPELRRIGNSQSPVVIVDGITGDVGSVIDLAAPLAPFGAAKGSHYPGVRRVIGDKDEAAMNYVQRTLETAAPFIGGGFDVDRFDLIEASFSMVTSRPESLRPAQRTPHFDSTDPDYLAVLHYLSDTPGTAFFRQRSTGIERVDDSNADRFVTAAQPERARSSGYVCDTDAAFERIGSVDGIADRLVIYQGCLLHSGIIPPDMVFSADPRIGRLTANFFVRAWRG